MCIMRTNNTENHVSITAFPSKSVINHCYKKVKQIFQFKNNFIMHLLKVNINELGVVRLDQIMSTPLTLNKCCSPSILVQFALHMPHIIL